MADPAQSVPSENRRVHPRFEYVVEVTLQSEHNFFTGFTENISEGGVFIATYSLRPIGTLLQFSFTLPDAPEPIEATGEVRWLREHDPVRMDSPPGIGVRFVELSEADKARVQAFVRQRETIFYDE